MTEGVGRLALYQSRQTVRAALVTAVDHALAQVTIRVADGSQELRHGTRAMFGGGHIPVPGDYLVEHGGARWIEPGEAFERGFVGVARPPRPGPLSAAFDVT